MHSHFDRFFVWNVALNFCLCAQGVGSLAAQGLSDNGKRELETIDTQRIDISTLNRRLRDEAGVSIEDSQAWLETRVKRILKAEPSAPAASIATAADKVSVMGVETSDGKQIDLELVQNRGALISGDELILVGPLAELRRVQEMVQTFEKFGIRQIVIKTLVFRDTADGIKHLKINWSHMEAATEHANRDKSIQTASFEKRSAKSTAGIYLERQQHAAEKTLPPPDGVTSATWTEAKSIVERATPVLYTLLTPSEYQAVVERTQQSATIQRLMSPTVVVFNGQIASISDSVERPFVTGIKPVLLNDGQSQQVEFTPSIQVVPEGTTMNIRPELSDGKNVRLNYQLDLCKVRSIETLALPGVDGHGEFSVQLPEVASTQFRTCLDMPINYALAVSAFETDDQGKKHSVVVLCQCMLRDVDTK